jgi:hypothetical protein
MTKPPLNPANVPPELALVLPHAEKWGIGDDIERELAIENAPTDQLYRLAQCLDQVEDAALVSWLTGAESQKQPLTAEYVAVTCLTMAVQSAKSELRRRAKAER